MQAGVKYVRKSAEHFCRTKKLCDRCDFLCRVVRLALNI